jgi:hypothetical protein
MEEDPENGKESSHSAHAKGMNEIQLSHQIDNHQDLFSKWPSGAKNLQITSKKHYNNFTKHVSLF